MTCHAAVSAFAVTREEEMLSTARHGARETETRHTPRRAGGGPRTRASAKDGNSATEGGTLLSLQPWFSRCGYSRVRTCILPSLVPALPLGLALRVGGAALPERAAISCSPAAARKAGAYWVVAYWAAASTAVASMAVASKAVASMVVASKAVAYRVVAWAWWRRRRGWTSRGWACASW